MGEAMLAIVLVGFLTVISQLVKLNGALGRIEALLRSAALKGE
jgi:hypothetical protein